MAVHLRLSRSIAPVGADAVALEDAELTGDRAGHPQVSFHELSANVVDMAQLVTGLADHLAAGGILFLALAMTGSVFMVFDLLFGTVTATIVAGSLVLIYAWFWYALPVSRRLRNSPSRR